MHLIVKVNNLDEYVDYSYITSLMLMEDNRYHHYAHKFKWAFRSLTNEFAE